MRIMHLATGRENIPTVKDLLRELDLDIREDAITNDDYGFFRWLRLSQNAVAWSDQDSYQWLAFHAIICFTQALELINAASNRALQEAATVKSLELSSESSWAYHVAFANSVADTTREVARKRFLELATTTDDVLSMHARLEQDLPENGADDFLRRALELAGTVEDCLSVCASACVGTDTAFASVAKARQLAASTAERNRVSEIANRLHRNACRNY